MKLELIQGDCLETLKTLDAGIVQTCVTSPPYYGLRSYNGGDAEIGLEETPAAYVAKLVEVFREVWRVLKDDGTLFLNLGDSYVGSHGNGSVAQSLGQSKFTKFTSPTSSVRGLKPKDLLMIPARVALALQADGWYLRSDIIWAKPNPMPESVKDRPTKSHEHIFLLSKNQKYYYDADAIAEPSVDDESLNGRRHRNPRQADLTGDKKLVQNITKLEGKVYETRNKRDVWTVNTKPYKGAHFATFPPALITPCILAGSAKGDVVLYPFNGSGTTGAVAIQHGRDYIGCELNPEYIELSHKRIAGVQTAL